MIRSLSLRTRCATASTRGSVLRADADVAPLDALLEPAPLDRDALERLPLDPRLPLARLLLARLLLARLLLARLPLARLPADRLPVDPPLADAPPLLLRVVRFAPVDRLPDEPVDAVRREAPPEPERDLEPLLLAWGTASSLVDGADWGHPTCRAGRSLRLEPRLHASAVPCYPKKRFGLSISI
jgi:hypothetical protein